MLGSARRSGTGKRMAAAAAALGLALAPIATGRAVLLHAPGAETGAAAEDAGGQAPLARQPDDTVAAPASPGPDDPEVDGAPPKAPQGPRGMASVLVTGVALLLAACSGWVIARRRLWTPARQAGWALDPPLEPVPDWPIVLMGGLVVWFAQQMGAATARVLFIGGDAGAASLRGVALLSLGGYGGAVIGLIFVLGMLPGMSRLIGVDAWRARLARDGWAGVRGFLLVFPLVVATGWASSRVAVMVARWRGTSEPNALAHDTLRQLAEAGGAIGAGALWWWMTVLGVTIGAPLAEELVYRGFLQGGLRRALRGRASHTGPRDAESQRGEGAGSAGADRGAWTAVLVTAVLFTLMHAPVVPAHALPTLLVLALGLGIVKERTGRVLACVAVHALFNVANIVLAMSSS